MPAARMGRVGPRPQESGERRVLDRQPQAGGAGRVRRWRAQELNPAGQGQVESRRFRREQRQQPVGFTPDPLGQRTVEAGQERTDF